MAKRRKKQSAASWPMNTELMLQGIWKDGRVYQMLSPVPSSTSVAIQSFMHRMEASDAIKRRIGEPWLFRVLHNGMLVREWDNVRKVYTLAIDDDFSADLLSSPKDRLYRAKDKTWWQRSENQAVLRCGPPEE